MTSVRSRRRVVTAAVAILAGALLSTGTPAFADGPTRLPQTISFQTAPPSPAYVGGTYSPRVSGGGSVSPVVLTAAAGSSCSVNLRGEVLLQLAGTCDLVATQAGDGQYADAKPVHQAFRITLVPVSVQLDTTPSSVTWPSAGTVRATVHAAVGAPSGTVQFVDVHAGVESPIGGPVPVVDGQATRSLGVREPGDYLVVAKFAPSEADAARFTTAQRLATVVVHQAVQKITFAGVPTERVPEGTTYTVRATGGASGQPVVLTGKTPATCAVTVTGAGRARVQTLAPGWCDVEARQAGDVHWAEAREVARVGVGVVATQLSVQPSDNAVARTPFTLDVNVLADDGSSPEGTIVVVLDNGLRSWTIDADGGYATSPSVKLPAGQHTVTAYFMPVDPSHHQAAWLVDTFRVVRQASH